MGIDILERCMGERVRNHSRFLKTKTLVQRKGSGIRAQHLIKLHRPKFCTPCHLQAMCDQ